MAGDEGGFRGKEKAQRVCESMPRLWLITKGKGSYAFEWADLA